MAISVLDEKQSPLSERQLSLTRLGDASARNDVEPLIRPSMAVSRPTLRGARRDHHLGRLGANIAKDDLESLPDLELLTLHKPYRRFK
jgi:hypothetical protein